MKNKGQHVHSKIELIQNYAMVKDEIEESRAAAKHMIKTTQEP